jgi:hypothetical protein
MLDELFMEDVGHLSDHVKRLLRAEQGSHGCNLHSAPFRRESLGFPAPGLPLA